MASTNGSGVKEFPASAVEAQSIQAATTNHSQQQNESHVVPIKDCITSDLTSSPHAFTRDVTAGFTGEAPHLHSNFTAATPPRTYNQTGNFSSFADPRRFTDPRRFADPRRHVFAYTNYRPSATTNYRPSASTNYRPSASTNYRPSGTVSNDRVSWSEKIRSAEFDTSKEMIRGPRFYRKNSNPESSVVKDEFAFTVCRDRYNLPDFQTKYETAKFYMIKSFNEDDIHKSIKYDVWTSTPHGNKKLNAAFQNAEAKLTETGTQCPVFLFFSVNTSGQFVGVAEMLGPVDFKKDMKFWKLDKYNGFFPIKWHIIKDVPNNQFLHIILKNNENKCVNFSRDTQEIGLKEGLEMLKIFKSYQAKTCLLDDFDFYENREKLSRSQRITEHADPKQEVYNNDSYRNTVKAREMRREMQSSGTTNEEILSRLTKNLSLNPYGRRGFR
ncbi:hypothetical protein TSUD_391100 [Trifolium subterraneum]|uniref:YTH domain-containing family protein n=1 Tax=Trifolium subterraneum TaxID=3900 RepID=A0A2Z6LXT7_TRISU|nr:hypothetical protein TSUD_391100 [Trifolium subterraneum]